MNYLVDPTKITHFHASIPELELYLLFWILAAGKNGTVAARNLDRLLSKWKSDKSPFEIISSITDLSLEMKSFGIGCYNNKSRTILSLIDKRLDLRNCTVDELESIKGIGPKTARCFLIHSRENQKYAGLDTHALKFLKSKGIDVPKSTPNGKKYKELEKVFLDYVEESGMIISEFDQRNWNKYRK